MTAVELVLKAPATGARSQGRITGANAVLTIARFGLDPLGEMLRIRARHGRLTEICVDERHKPRRYLLASGADYNQRVLSDLESFQALGAMLPGPRGSAQRQLGRGLLGPHGPTYTHYRRMLLPPMRRKAIDQLTQTMSNIVDAEIDKWPKDGPIDLFPLCQTLVRRAALEILFSGIEGQCGHEMLEAARVMDDHIEMEASPFARGLPRDWPGLPYRRVLRHAGVVQDALRTWARKESNCGREESLLCLIASKPTEAGAPGGEEAVLNHLPSLFGAAYETMQTALVWALFLLAQHPRAAGALLDELNALPDDNPDRLLECSWLDAVVRESMRILPSVPTQTRRATKPTDLVNREIDTGTFVVLSSFLSHREPDVFSEPDRFKPERWAEIDPNQWAYMPFSAGPRTCMGSWFASNFMHIALGRITKRYRLKVTPGARIDAKVRITLRPGRSGVPVSVSAQDGRFEASPTVGNIHKVVRFDA